MIYQLPNGKVINISIEQYLDMTDQDIQYLMSINGGDYATNPFTDSAVVNNAKEKAYDFDYLASDEEDVDNIISDDEPFDDIIDLNNPLDI